MQQNQELTFIFGVAFLILLQQTHIWDCVSIRISKLQCCRFECVYIRI